MPLCTWSSHPGGRLPGSWDGAARTQDLIDPGLHTRIGVAAFPYTPTSQKTCSHSLTSLMILLQVIRSRVTISVLYLSLSFLEMLLYFSYICFLRTKNRGVRGTVSPEGGEEHDISHTSCSTEEGCSPQGHGPGQEGREAVPGIFMSLKHMRGLVPAQEPLEVGMSSVMGVSSGYCEPAPMPYKLMLMKWLKAALSHHP